MYQHFYQHFKVGERVMPPGGIVHIGDTVFRKPVTLDFTNEERAGLYGKVIFIHPQGRFYTVEFSFGAGKLRDCFFGIDR